MATEHSSWPSIGQKGEGSLSKQFLCSSTAPCPPMPLPVHFRGPTNGVRKGTNGISTNRVTSNFMFFDRDFLGTPINLLLSSQKWQGVFFSQAVKIHYFCSGPMGVDPIRPQPRCSFVFRLSLVRGWWHAVGNLIDFLWLDEHLSRASTCLYACDNIVLLMIYYY